MENEQRIKDEMFQTRAALAEKLETLEQRFSGTVDQVTAVVSDTVAVIKDTVHDAKATADAVNETVQESVKSVQKSLDVSAHVQAHPWVAVAGSVAAGLCLGAMFRKQAGTNGEPRAAYRPATFPGNGTPLEPRHNGNGTQAAAAKSESEPSLWAAEIEKLKGLALGALFGTVREMVAASLPEPVNQQVKEIFDSATEKVGGKPIASAAFAGLMQPRPIRVKPKPPGFHHNPALAEVSDNMPPDVGGEA